MQLGSLGNRIWHAAARRNPAGNTGGDNEYSSVRVGVEGGLCLTHQEQLGFDIDCVAGVPVLDGRGIEVCKIRETGVALIGVRC